RSRRWAGGSSRRRRAAPHAGRCRSRSPEAGGTRTTGPWRPRGSHACGTNPAAPCGDRVRRSPTAALVPSGARARSHAIARAAERSSSCGPLFGGRIGVLRAGRSKELRGVEVSEASAMAQFAEVHAKAGAAHLAPAMLELLDPHHARPAVPPRPLHDFFGGLLEDPLTRGLAAQLAHLCLPPVLPIDGHIADHRRLGT